MRFTTNKPLVAAAALAASFAVSPVASANTDTGIFHLHPHGFETMASVCVIAAMLVFAYVRFNAARNRR